MTNPLRLAIGSHKAGTGKGCAMNVISWENGDTEITDMPACSHPFLTRIVQRVNDSICTHRDADLLCAECSLTVLDLGHRTVGTGGTDPDFRITVQVAAEEAQRVAYLNGDPAVQAAIDAAMAWVENPTAHAANAANAATNAAAAYAAANAANAAADAAYAAARAADAAYAANAANAANDAANAANATYAAAYAAANATYAAAAANAAGRVIDRFRELAGLDTPTVDPARTRHAIEQMLTVTR